MNHHTQLVVAVVLGILLGAGGLFVFSDTKVGMGPGHRMPDGSMMQDEMHDMMQALQGKTGDAFDETFLTEMIVHHEGAVVMAEAALVHAKHQEIKDLAKNIIDAQNKEIEQMRTWQESWYSR